MKTEVKKWTYRALIVFAVLLMPILTAAKAPEKQMKVSHLFTHALIAHPQIAFAEGNRMAKDYDHDCLTPTEFKKILAQLYRRNFRLTDVAQLYKKHGGGVKKVAANFPKGYKPLVLSFDDINYYRKKMGLGMADKLVLSGGKVATYTQNAANPISSDNDAIPILENFIAAHPDFSINGARGIINLTGFDGILGYRTDRNSKNRAQETEAVKPIVAELKRLGWRFASHSYGHYHMTQISDAKFFDDADKWKKEVEPLIGSTDCYAYPYGEFEKEVIKKRTLTLKHRRLLQAGFRFFMGVGASGYFSESNVGNVPQIFMDRIPLDGFTMRKNGKVLRKFFDVAAVYDSVRPLPLDA